MDERIKQLAFNLVHYSCRLQKGAVKQLPGCGHTGSYDSDAGVSGGDPEDVTGMDERWRWGYICPGWLKSGRSVIVAMRKIKEERKI